MTKHAGFSLIELITVLLVVGILATIAVPIFNTISLKAQVTEGMTLARPVQMAVAEYFVENGEPPADRAAVGFGGATESSGKYVTSVGINDGSVVVTYGNDAAGSISGSTLTFVPFENDNGDILWRCGYAGDPGDLLGTANDAAAEDVESTIDSKYLPGSCK